jgi:hypothetical protein
MDERNFFPLSGIDPRLLLGPPNESGLTRNAADSDIKLKKKKREREREREEKLHAHTLTHAQAVTCTREEHVSAALLV